MSLESIRTQQLEVIPSSTTGISMIMLKPDIVTMPTLSSTAAKDILIGLGDALSGNVFPDFYRSSHFARTAEWALNKRGSPDNLGDLERAKLVMGLEAMRVRIPNEEHEINLTQFVRDTLSAVNYEVVGEVECSFTEPWIRRLYTNLNRPDPVYGEAWKQTVVDALQEGPLRFMFLKGPLDHKFLDIMKDIMRKTLRNYGNDVGNLAKNIVHVPDEGEMAMTLDILKDYFSIDI